jgi:hypothetical protein
MRLLAIALSTSMASLALAMPSQAAGYVTLKGQGVESGANARLRGEFTLTAHDGEKKPFDGSIKVGLGGIQIGATLANDRHGTTSRHQASVVFKPSKENDKIFNWELEAKAKIKPACNPKGGCEAVYADTFGQLDIDGYGTETFHALDISDGKIVPQPPGKKDPIVTFFLDGQQFFSANIFATTPQGPGLEPTLHADFSFGTLAPGYDITLFHEGHSCGLASCSSDTSFLNSLQTIVSTGPGGNWSFDPVIKGFTNNNSIALPDFMFTKSVGETGTFGISSEGSDPGIEVPGPLPILGVAAAFGYSRKLRKRLKSSKSEVISTTAV